MEIVFLVPLFFMITTSGGTHCDKELNYHDGYTYGTDIVCDGLSDDSSKLLEEISVSKELALTINNSNLTRVTPNLFVNVKKIRFLSIRNSTIHCDPHEKLFIDLTKLEHFTIENTIFDHFTLSVFQGLDNLKELNLLNTGLRVIRNGTFSVFEKLETLRLTNNYFREVFNIPFCELPALKHLELDSNRIEEIGDNFLICFEKEDESAFNLNGKNYEVKYHSEELYHQTRSKLKLVQLNLSHNYLKKIVQLEWAPDLKFLNLSNNRFRNVNEKLFSVLKDLEVLSLENNLLEKLDPKTFQNLANLKLVNLENNTLSNVWFVNLSSLEEVNLSHNRLNSQSLTHLKGLPKLRTLLLNGNSIEKLPDKVLCHFSSLQILDLSNNLLTIDQLSFQNLTNLKQLILKNNSLDALPHSVFTNLSNLEVVDISVNRLQTLQDHRTFVGLEFLHVLNLSHNLIEELSIDLLKPLHNLQVLDLSGNKLHSFQINLISLLPSLSVINIRSNLLSCDSLADIIKFLKSKNITYTINEEFEYEKQNIDGIYCVEVAKISQDEGSSGGRFASGLGILFILVISCIVISFVFYKCLLYARRRRYHMDEMELL